ncbi:hypothetical protein P7K49_033974, partial [Saguinus oedipus]
MGVVYPGLQWTPCAQEGEVEAQGLTMRLESGALAIGGLGNLNCIPRVKVVSAGGQQVQMCALDGLEKYRVTAEWKTVERRKTGGMETNYKAVVMVWERNDEHL